VVLNKIDLPDAVAWEPLIAERMEAEGYEFCAISAVTGHGVRQMLFRAKQLLDRTPAPEPQFFETVIMPEKDEEAFTITRERDGWRVSGVKIERIAAMTYFEFEATAMRFQGILEGMGISDALREAGIHVGDTVYIGDETLEWQDDSG
jgi:GTP-binding protein